MTRERWTEAELEALPAEEPDVFERKAGKLFDEKGEFLDTVAKYSCKGALRFCELRRRIADYRGRERRHAGWPSATLWGAATRDWIEQKVPHLLDYPLSDFRVHTVVKSDPSRIPTGRDVIVIDVGDSAAAPHQSKRDKIYYRREGGRSERAPHFYLELLRQRLTNPILEFKFKTIDPADVFEHDDGLFLRVELKFEIENVGRVAAYEWQLGVRQISREDEKISEARLSTDYRFADFPGKRGPSSIPLTRTILPGCKFI